MEFKFTKMHGIGNDFVVIDCINQPVVLSAAQARLIADRRLGVGCDQILLVEAPRSENVAFGYRIFNADGSEVSQCGNGARCFARFVIDKKLTAANEIAVETASGMLILSALEDGQIKVNMGIPTLDPAKIPFDAAHFQSLYDLDVDGANVTLSAISMGNPHAVLQVDDIAAAPVESLGSKIEMHPAFPQRVNVGFMQLINDSHIRLRVFERGAGETLACGSGACAAVVAGQLTNQLAQQVRVDLPGGQLMIEWQGKHSPVLMTGPAETVFEGSMTL